ncbi:MAG TPA: Lrp/AsnC family transcriptional regulator [Kiloniellaceae bacterium]|nr:Lrp/AsnC family transcriptional regulator [Kiloniellaceae bacterium]HIP80506.1 Lrp/AsnC family transcriptional regulator [Kiloniellaceae bacterium]
MDAMDRKLLGLLAEDATLSYKDMGERLHLSAPAVHERVKKLKKAGAITGTVARLDGAAVGRPLCAFIHMDTEGWGKSPELMAIQDDSRVEEIHAVAGDTCVILKVRCESTKALEDILHRLYQVPGMIRTQSYIVLNTYLERGPGV